MKKIVICGGHLTPAQALIEKLQQEKKLKIFFFGRKKVTEGSKNISTEYKQISQLDVTFVNITAGRIQRNVTRHFVSSLIKIPVGFIQSFVNLLIIRPSLVVSFGGSISFPVVFSAWLLGIDSITHEQAVVPGFSNKLNAYFVSKIYLAWQQAASSFPKEKTKVIGNLIRNSLLEKNSKTQTKSKNTLFVMGGNQGSHFLNTFIFENIEALKDYDIIHQVGTANFKDDWQKAKSIKKKNYRWYEFVPAEELKSIYQKSQLVLGRAGANTIWELAIFGKVAILVPLPYSAGSEQEKNAQVLESAGSAIVINQEQATVPTLLSSLQSAKTNYAQMQGSARSFSLKLPRDAAKVMAEDILSLLALRT